MFEKFIEKQRADKERRERELADMRERERISLINETRELLTISNKNVIEINSSINNFNFRLNYVRGDNRGETRKRRESLRKLIDLYITRLNEELYWVEYYEHKLKRL